MGAIEDALRGNIFADAPAASAAMMPLALAGLRADSRYIRDIFGQRDARRI